LVENYREEDSVTAGNYYFQAEQDVMRLQDIGQADLWKAKRKNAALT